MSGSSDLSPSTFWITSVQNHWIGNVAAGSRVFGFWLETNGGTLDPISTFKDNVAHNNERDGIIRESILSLAIAFCSGVSMI